MAALLDAAARSMVAFIAFWTADDTAGLACRNKNCVAEMAWEATRAESVGCAETTPACDASERCRAVSMYCALAVAVGVGDTSSLDA